MDRCKCLFKLLAICGILLHGVQRVKPPLALLMNKSISPSEMICLIIQDIGPHAIIFFYYHTFLLLFSNKVHTRVPRRLVYMTHKREKIAVKIGECPRFKRSKWFNTSVHMSASCMRPIAFYATLSQTWPYPDFRWGPKVIAVFYFHVFLWNIAHIIILWYQQRVSLYILNKMKFEQVLWLILHSGQFVQLKFNCLCIWWCSTGVSNNYLNQDCS